MKVYFLKSPVEGEYRTTEERELIHPVLPDSISIYEFEYSRPRLGEIILIYAPFTDPAGRQEDRIFSYFEVGRVTDDALYPSERLTFDPARAGRGTLGFSARRLLTRYSDECAHWGLPEFFRGLHVAHGRKEMSARFFSEGNVRYFDNTERWFSVESVPSRDSGMFYDSALSEWVSSLTEDIRGEVTRAFCEKKKGSVGEGKTGFVKYSFRPDRRRSFYCRTSHVIGRKKRNECEGCPIYKGDTCEWSLPVYGSMPYVPLSSRDAFAYFDVLLEKGLVMDYRD